MPREPASEGLEGWVVLVGLSATLLDGEFPWGICARGPLQGWELVLCVCVGGASFPHPDSLTAWPGLPCPGVLSFMADVCPLPCPPPWREETVEEVPWHHAQNLKSGLKFSGLCRFVTGVTPTNDTDLKRCPFPHNLCFYGCLISV